MTAFDDRLKGELSKFQHDVELAFRVRLRRDRLFALKVAKQLGLSAEQAVEYAKAVVLADLNKAGDEPIIEKVASDLRERGAAVDTVGLQRDLDRLLEEARKQVMDE